MNAFNPQSVPARRGNPQSPGWIAAVMIIAAGAVYGSLTDRWGLAPELEASVVRLPKLPLNLGEWRGEEVVPTDVQKKQLAKAEVRSYVMRRYVDRKTGEAIALLVVCGRPGPIATHSPEVCYTGRGLEMTAQNRYAVPGMSPAGEFWVGDFHKEGPVVDSGLRIFWSWSPDGVWKAVANPRVAFAARPALYKVYVIQETVRSGPPRADEAGARFLAALLPALDRAVFPPAETPAPARRSTRAA
jgi:hypothetical protein